VLGGNQTPWEPGWWSYTGRGINHVRTKDSGTTHVLVNLWLTLKLTGWLASLDMTKATSDAFSATKRHPPMPCMTYWVWTGEGLNHERFGGERSRTTRRRQHIQSKQGLIHLPDSEELWIHRHHIFSKTGTASTYSKLRMAAYQGGVHSIGANIVIMLLCYLCFSCLLE